MVLGKAVLSGSFVAASILTVFVSWKTEPAQTQMYGAEAWRQKCSHSLTVCGGLRGDCVWPAALIQSIPGA